jgi:hypothetical protein
MPTPRKTVRLDPAEKAARVAWNMSVRELRVFIERLQYGLHGRFHNTRNVSEARDLYNLYRRLYDAFSKST